MILVAFFDATPGYEDDAKRQKFAKSYLNGLRFLYKKFDDDNNVRNLISFISGC